MNLPIGSYGYLLGFCALVALASGIWLLLRLRDVARIADTPDSDLVAGRARRAPASRKTVRAVLAVNIIATVAALGILALVATGAINSSDTRTDPQAQRP